VGLIMQRSAVSGQRSANPVQPRRALAVGFCCLLLAGCMGLSTSRNPTPSSTAPLIQETPTAEALVTYLNRNTAKVTSLATTEVDLDIKADGQSIGVHGDLHCQKPRNFRLRAKKPVLSGIAADFGSNDQEFWYWISQDNPPDLYHCSYADMARGNVRLPFPLHPEWVLEVLGMGAPAPIGSPEEEQARGRTFEVKKSNDNKFINLYEHTKSLQGQSVTKVTVLNNFTANGTTPQVAGYFLYDANQKMICKANVTKVQYDAASGTTIPKVVELSWPAMKLSLAMTLDKVKVNGGDLTSNPKLFARPTYQGAREVDLARGAPLMTPAGVQRAGAFR
jgi:hypothetical protein